MPHSDSLENDTGSLRLLSLDGGGTRGLSSLIILRSLMKKIDAENPPKPCDYFHLIGGTSTGGLIALMLGRMKMDVDTCIKKYLTLAPEMFTQKRPIWDKFGKISNLWPVRARYNAEKLELGFKHAAIESGMDKEALLFESSSTSSCKVFVCAYTKWLFTKSANSHIRLRSYDTDVSVSSFSTSKCKIWEAARATSAAATLVDPIKIGLQEYADGATGCSNPVNAVLEEAKAIWRDAPSRIQCLLSIGTGAPNLDGFDSNIKEVVETLKTISTETEDTDKQFFRDSASLGVGGRYFRFNVNSGLEKAALDEHDVESIGRIMVASKAYLLERKVHKMVEDFSSATSPQHNSGFHRMPYFKNHYALEKAYIDADKLSESLNRMLGETDWSHLDMVGDEHLIYTDYELSSEQLMLLANKSKHYYSFREENKRIRDIAERSAPTDLSKKPNGVESDQNPLSVSTSKNTESGLSLSKQIDEPGAHTSVQHEHDSILQEIPAATAANGFTTPKSMGLDINFRFVYEPELSMESKGKQLKGLCSLQVDVGETASVFEVSATVDSESDPQQGYKGDAVHKLAIKRLKESTSLDVFVSEYKALWRANKLDHPNIVETLSVFQYEENGLQYFNFAFPLALGNLKRLFRGDYDADQSVLQARGSLWHQYAPLTSAVAYLHDSTNTAHRDIKPSNILMYLSKVPGELILKITDFGLAVDLTKAISWEHGTLAAQSAQTYDSPEMPKGDSKGIPSAKELLSNDIWKLGCVFTEMTAFLTSGSRGIVDFRNHITTTEGKIRSDCFNDTMVDDGEKVKSEVLEWMDNIPASAVAGLRASQLNPILKKMLAKSIERPSASEVFSSLAKIPFSGIAYDDGMRLIRFTDGNEVASLSYFDQTRYRFQEWFREPIDWDPLPQMPPVCSSEEGVVSWRFEMRRQKDHVTPVKDWDLPPQGDGWRHNIIDPIEDRMRILSEEIVYGLKYPNIDYDEDRDLIVSKLPMKQQPPGLARTFGSQGWGLLVTMGFSYWGFLRWALGCLVLTIISAAVWFRFVDNTSKTAALPHYSTPFSLLQWLLLKRARIHGITNARQSLTDKVWHPQILR
ncbi:hypothetical protein INS49_013636 [Diaporthe citri]|uniref:uncharacterized protein n=1 Tax=Diaporthe citri TaxID=83186 RepID=UPI001C7F1A57|nr:uncharacterized protein INS49_013636 [Diaporthe citri]KAG6357757.1 hypothetical protein INS49_013636 [Diaporthe citri]